MNFPFVGIDKPKFMVLISCLSVEIVGCGSRAVCEAATAGCCAHGACGAGRVGLFWEDEANRERLLTPLPVSIGTNPSVKEHGRR